VLLEKREVPTASHSGCLACGEFMKIPPTVRGDNGLWYANPDYDMQKKFLLQATGPSDYSGGGTTTTLAAGQTADFMLTNPAEENGLGDLLINEFRATFLRAGATAVTGIAVEIESLQNDRLFTNAPVYNTLMWGDGFLNCCLPCCMLLQATNSIVLRVTNNEAVSVNCLFEAVGKKLLPYQDPGLQGRMLAYFNSIPTTPYWLTLDEEEVTVPDGESVTAYMTVPGGGNFEVKQIRAQCIPAGAGTDEDTVTVQVIDGVGRSWSNLPIPLSAIATVTRAVIGMPNGGTYAAAQACSCEQYTQWFKGNTRVKVIFTNNGTDDAVVRWTMVGCMHYVGSCPPGDSLNRIRSLEPTIGPVLIDSDSMCDTAFQTAVPVPGRGMVPVSQLNSSGPLPSWPTAPVAPAPKPILGPGYGAALAAGVQGMGVVTPQQARAMAQARARQRSGAGNGQWRSI